VATVVELGVEDDDGISTGFTRDVKDERNDRCRFQMSIKLEKMEVSVDRSNNGSDVSRDTMIGVRKCWRDIRWRLAKRELRRTE